MRAYLDACAVIYYIERHPHHFSRVDALLNDPVTEPFVSDLCRLECRTKPLREQNIRLLAAYDLFFRSTNLRSAPLRSETFDLATELRARHRLKTPDALHLASALQSGCNALWTNDRHLEKAADGRIAVVSLD